jgi:hypothetical protein
MEKIYWHRDLPEATNQIFLLDNKKTWKGKMIRGYDIAEMISHEVWETTSETLPRLHITSPANYRGTYEIQAEFEPIFSAKRVDI